MASLIRIILLLGLVGGVGYVVYQQPQLISQLLRQPQVVDTVNYAQDQVRGATSSLNLDTAPVIDTLVKKLIDKDIIQPSSSADATNSSSATFELQQITNQITEELKDIPKNQAKELIQNTCQQIIDNLDKQ